MVTRVERHAGERVREVRRGRALTQAELAVKAGMSTDTVNKVENGFHEPRPSTVRKLAVALGVEVEAITGGV